MNETPVTYMPGGEPSLHIGGPIGCVLVHGYTGAPQEMRWLGEYLAARNLTVLLVRLTGHGTVKEDMAPAVWRHWVGDALNAITLLRQNCAQVYIAGLSMGGLLSLYSGIHYPVDGVVSLAAPIYLENPRLRYLPVLKYFLRYIPKGDPAIEARETGRVGYRYDIVPSVIELMRLIKHVDANLPRLAVPLLLMHSREDKTAPPGCMPRIYERAGSVDKDMHWVESGGHVITEGEHREFVYETVWAFIREHAAGFREESPAPAQGAEFW